MVIAVVADDGDLTADHLILRAREMSLETVRLSVDRLEQSGISSSYRSGQRDRAELLLDDHPITGVWCRTASLLTSKRPETFHTDDFARLQWTLALHAFEGTGAGSICWMNPPSSFALSSNKLHQLELCRHIGLRVPDTLLSNQPATIRAFARDQGAIVMKALRSGSITLADGEARTAFTTLTTLENLELESGLDEFPALFQRYLAGIDVRVCIVGSELFAFQCSPANDERSNVDWRAENEVHWEPVVLTESIAQRLRQLVGTMGLTYSAIDLIRERTESEYYVLEVNPSGQWAFLDPNNEVTDAILYRLAGGRPGSS